MEHFTVTERPLLLEEAKQLSAAIRETPNILGYRPHELMASPLCYVAQTKDGVFAGACVTKKLASRWSEMAAMVVLPAYRGQGIGTELFKRAFEGMRKQDVNVLCVSCEPSVLRLMERAQMEFIPEWQLPVAVQFAKMRHYSNWYRWKEGFRKTPMYKGQGPFRNAIFRR